MSHNPMNDTLDFVKSLWGSMSVPGLTAPPCRWKSWTRKSTTSKPWRAGSI
jgi:hypothetical protein